MTQGDFGALGLRGELLRALREAQYLTPTPIQREAIPGLVSGRDLLGIAQTGTGKTAAFALPLLQAGLEAGRAPAAAKSPRVLILAPTRELTLQIHSELEKLGRHAGQRFGCVIGGVGQNPQVRALARGIELLVATPGRLLDLANSRHVNLGAVEHLVLDEADRLLDMGFIRDVRRIVALTPRTRQSLLFSATMPDAVATLAREILRDPIRIDVTPKKVTADHIEQHVLHVENARKQTVLERLLRDPSVSRAIVFSRTKHGANRVADRLQRAGICAEAIHGNKSQNARQRALDSFRSGSSWVLVATDIAARGIDIEGVSHVINFELPHEPESYVHRIGRTARAGASGVAWSLVDPTESKRLRAVEKLIKLRPPVMAEPSAASPAAREARASASATRATTAAEADTRRRDSGNRKQQTGVTEHAEASGRMAKTAPAANRRRSRRRRRPASALA